MQMKWLSSLSGVGIKKATKKKGKATLKLDSEADGL